MLSGFTLTLLRQRHFALAEPLQRSLLEMHRRVHGLGHKDTLTAAADLAVALSEQAKYAEAEAMFAEVLPEMQRMYGDADLSTLNAVRGLALAKLCQGKQVHQCCDATWWWPPRAVIGSRLLPFLGSVGRLLLSAGSAPLLTHRSRVRSACARNLNLASGNRFAG